MPGCLSTWVPKERQHRTAQRQTKRASRPPRRGRLPVAQDASPGKRGGYETGAPVGATAAREGWQSPLTGLGTRLECGLSPLAKAGTSGTGVRHLSERPKGARHRAAKRRARPPPDKADVLALATWSRWNGARDSNACLKLWPGAVFWWVGSNGWRPACRANS